MRRRRPIKSNFVGFAFGSVDKGRRVIIRSESSRGIYPQTWPGQAGGNKRAGCCGVKSWLTRSLNVF